MMIKIYVFVFLVLFSVLRAAELPISPCPEYFSYEVTPRKISGRINIPFKGLPIHLTVSASLRGSYGRKKSIMLIELLNKPSDLILGVVDKVQYRIIFPLQKSIPQITKIAVNRKTICTGPSITLTPGDMEEGFDTIYNRKIIHDLVKPLKDNNAVIVNEYEDY